MTASGTPSPTELDLARAALEAEQLGNTLKRDESRAIAKHRKRIDGELRRAHYGAVPQAELRKLAGIPHRKQMHDLNRQFAFRCIGTHVDLGELLPDLFGWVRRNHRAVSAAQAEDPLLVGSGESSPALEKYRWEKYRLTRLDRQERERELIRYDDISEWLGRLSDRMRDFGERLQREFGSEAHALLDEFLNDFEGEVSTWAGKLLSRDQVGGDAHGNGEGGRMSVADGR